MIKLKDLQFVDVIDAIHQVIYLCIVRDTKQICRTYYGCRIMHN